MASVEDDPFRGFDEKIPRANAGLGCWLQVLILLLVTGGIAFGVAKALTGPKNDRTELLLGIAHAQVFLGKFRIEDPNVSFESEFQGDTVQGVGRAEVFGCAFYFSGTRVD